MENDLDDEMLQAALDAMLGMFMAKLTKEQTARMAIGYFSAVEAWSLDTKITEGLEQFHRDMKEVLTGVSPDAQG